MRHTLKLLLFVLLPWLCAATLQAQTRSGTEPAAYRPTIERALQEFDLGNYEEARQQFSQAHALAPNARTLRGLGMSEFELRNYVESVEYLEQALASQTKALQGALRTETEALLLRAREYVGRVELSIIPQHAQVLVDGFPGTQSPPGNGLVLNLGDHMLEFHAEGWISQRRAVSVRGGALEKVAVSLQRSPAGHSDLGPVPRNVPTRTDAEATPLYKRWWLRTLVGVVVAGAATTTALMLTRDPSEEYQGVPSENTPSGVQLRPWRSF